MLKQLLSENKKLVHRYIKQQRRFPSLDYCVTNWGISFSDADKSETEIYEQFKIAFLKTDLECKRIIEYEDKMLREKIKHQAEIKKLIEQQKVEEKKKYKRNIAVKYARLCKRLSRVASKPEALGNGITAYDIESIFGNITSLKEYAQSHYPNLFNFAEDIRLFNVKRKAEVEEHTKTCKTFILSYARENAEVNENFYKAIQTYNKKNNSKLLLFAENNDKVKVDKKLHKENFILSNSSLNPHLVLVTVKTPAICANPLMKLEEFSSNSESIVIGHPKQELETIAKHRDADALPRIKFSTGAITLPNYNTINDPLLSRQNSFAELSHVCGGFIVENGDGGEFHVRNIIANEDGSFYDLGYLYMPDGTIKNTKDQLEKPVIVFPDLHWGDHAEVPLQTFERLGRDIGADTAVLHDVHDFRSINHHEADQKLTKALRFKNGDGFLEKELDEAKLAYDRFTNNFQNVIVVKSNHDNFLLKYLNDGNFEAQNHFISAKLTSAIDAYDVDPLVWYYTMNDIESKRVNEPSKIRWLKEDAIEQIHHVTISKHGHRGKNGSRGISIPSMFSAYGRFVAGHTHCPKIKREGYLVGYCGGEHPYAEGDASGWMITAATIYPSGSVQLITCVNGKYSVNDKE